MEVKVVLNVVCVVPDGPSLYKVFLDENFRSPSAILQDGDSLEECVKGIYESCFNGYSAKILETLNLVDVRKTADRLVIYYSVCADSKIQNSRGKFVSVDSLNSEILHKILQKIDMSVRFT